MENLDVTTVIFAVVAIFVVFKLRSVLGTRTGNERRPPEPPPPPAPGATPAPPAPNVISLGVRRAAQPPRRQRPTAGDPTRKRARRSPRGSIRSPPSSRSSIPPPS